ncbi:uncharacterized protein LOC114308334 [Camellia sinensis]|uniref:uncharacterized protein LOC114308334 n=1 Tax=Camellia sinensis TaxID=4442 RepID=UPI001035BF17|nr:uncharacterized protein LOC114308334 [Camellia sinensis]
MPPPHSQKALKNFLGKVSYLRRFIPALAEITFSFGTLLKGNQKFEWLQEHQQAFDVVKKALTMIALQPNKPLLLYLMSTPRSIGALLVQDVDGIEKPVYYISRKSSSVLFLMAGAWLLALAEYDITCVTPKAIKSQALADLLAQFPSGEHEPAEVSLPGAVHVSAAAVEAYRDLKFDGASGSGKGRAGITLTSEEEEKFHLSYKLDFECSNNEVEYKALILGLIAAQKKGLRKLKILGDSELVVKYLFYTISPSEYCIYLILDMTFCPLTKKFCLTAQDFHKDTGSPVGALVSQDVNRSDDLKQLYPEPSQCTCYVLEDVSLSELGNSLTEFLHIQDDKKLASSSNLVQPADKTDNFNVEKEDKCKDLDQTEPTTVTSEKFFPKCATFACSGKKASLAVSANVEDDINAAVLEKNGHESVNPACPQSISLPTPSKLVTAIKGSREKQGMTPPEKLTVRWAPDVYDPPPSISISTSGKIKKPRPKSESKRYYDYKNGKNKQKGKPSKGSSSKDKKHVRKHSGSSNKYYQMLDNDDRVVDYNEPCGESGGFGVGSPNSYCGSSFLKKSVRELHFSIAEAT